MSCIIDWAKKHPILSTTLVVGSAAGIFIAYQQQEGL
jgi:hypothetical protein